MAEYCITAFANGRGNYIKGLGRLASSLTNNFSGKFLGWVGENAVGAPDHLLEPYAFKIYTIEKALQLGYRKILYLDCSVFAVRNVQPIFDIIDREGYAFQESGHYLSRWINDEALNYFGISRDAIAGVVMHGNAGACGLDFDQEKPRIFFEKWKASMLAGAFRGSWENHRHDMACASMIAWLMHMPQNIRGDEILEYAGADDPIKNDTIIFKAQGM